MRTILWLVAFCAVLAGCARNASLYPMNDQAAAGGALRAHFNADGTGHCHIQISTPDGEVLQGEYSMVRGAAVGFGTIYGSVYGSAGATAYRSQATSYAMAGGSPGTASASDDRGTSIQCEFYNDNVSGRGYGACRSSKGALYRLVY